VIDDNTMTLIMQSIHDFIHWHLPSPNSKCQKHEFMQRSYGRWAVGLAIDSLLADDEGDCIDDIDILIDKLYRFQRIKFNYAFAVAINTLKFLEIWLMDYGLSDRYFHEEKEVRLPKWTMKLS